MATTDAGREAWLCMVELFTSQENARRFSDAAESIDLSCSMLRGLLRLAPGEARPMRALVEEWHCDPSWVTSIVDELEQRDLVERRVDDVDRRAKTVTLTAQGEKQREQAFSVLSVPPPGIAELSGPEQRTLRDLLRRATAGAPQLP
ncbi:MAG: MarR family winged helix-turn-helix transcriptional regulator [Acidimicrobiales bacterium]